jgi:hypothetical protein
MRQFMLNIANAWPPFFAEELRKNEAAFEKEVSTGKDPDGTVLTAGQRRKMKTTCASNANSPPKR